MEYNIHKVGGLAQLGERLHGMQEVTSSSLVSSTIFLPAVSDCLPRQGKVHYFSLLSRTSPSFVFEFSPPSRARPRPIRRVKPLSNTPKIVR